jgi:AcrR family transcriptional regulator
VPRAGLTPAKVIAEAADVADAEGWDALSLATVAARLGVKLPSLYKHVASVAALRQGVAGLATRELADAMADAALGRAQGDALTAVAHAYRDYARRHPGRYAATVAAPRADAAEHLAAADAAVRAVSATVAGYGLVPEDQIHAIRAVRAALHGFVSLEAGGGFGLPLDIDVSFDRLVAGLNATISRWAAGAAGAAI